MTQTPLKSQGIVDRLRQKLDGSTASLQAKTEASKSGNFLLAIALNACARKKAGATLTDLEQKLVTLFQNAGLSDSDLDAMGEVYTTAPLSGRSAVFSERFANLNTETGYSLADLKADLPKLGEEALSNPNVRFRLSNSDQPDYIPPGDPEPGISTICYCLPLESETDSSAKSSLESETDSSAKAIREQYMTVSVSPYKVICHKGTHEVGNDEPYFGFSVTDDVTSEKYQSEIFSMDEGDTRYFRDHTIWHHRLNGGGLWIVIDAWEQDSAGQYEVLDRLLSNTINFLEEELTIDSWDDALTAIVGGLFGGGIPTAIAAMAHSTAIVIRELINNPHDHLGTHQIILADHVLETWNRYESHYLSLYMDHDDENHGIYELVVKVDIGTGYGFAESFINAAVNWGNGKAYFFQGHECIRFDLVTHLPDEGYPKMIKDEFPGLDSFTADLAYDGIDAVLEWKDGKVYFFAGSQYIRYDIAANRADEGYPMDISDGWEGLGSWNTFGHVDAAVNWGNGKIYFFSGDHYTRYDIAADKEDPDYPKLLPTYWPGLEPFADGIDAAINFGNGKAYFFNRDQYIRYDIAADKADEGYPKSVQDNWNLNFSSVPFKVCPRDIDAAMEWSDSKAYYFKKDECIRYDIAINRPDEGYPKLIKDEFPGLEPFAGGIDAALKWINGKIYFFKGSQYIRYDIAANRADEGYPMDIADGWEGLGSLNTFGHVDAAVNWGNGKVYFFSGDYYTRYDIAADKEDPDYPQRLPTYWPGLEPFADGIDAAINLGNGKVLFFKGSEYISYDIAADKADGSPLKIQGFLNLAFTP